MARFLQEIRLPVKAGESLDIQRLIGVLEGAKDLGADLSTLHIEMDQIQSRSWVVFAPFPAAMDPIKWMPHEAVDDLGWAKKVKEWKEFEEAQRPKKIPLTAQKKAAAKVEEVKPVEVEAAPVEVAPEVEVVTNG